MTIIGIDPGCFGAVAFLGEHENPLSVIDIPSFSIERSRKGHRHEIDVGSLVSMLEIYVPDLEMGISTHLFLEKVGSMPGEGAAGAFSFGKTCGLIEGVVQALKIPFEFVSPQKWKKAMMPGTAKDKGQSIIVAKRLLPTASDWLTLRKHDGRADALLIALYGLRKLKGGL